MKKSKLILSAILLCAAVGAYASSHNLRLIDSFYIHNGVCVEYIEVPCTPGTPTCEDFTPDGQKLLFASDTPAAGLPCSEPLELE